jgi:hypothetical protein
MKPTFTLRRRDGITEVVPYTPVMVIVGTTAHKLALHRDNVGQWVVSDPHSGACVIRHLSGTWKGCRISANNVTLKDMRHIAHEAVELLVQRIGSDKFNATLANPKPF